MADERKRNESHVWLINRAAIFPVAGKPGWQSSRPVLLKERITQCPREIRPSRRQRPCAADALEEDPVVREDTPSLGRVLLLTRRAIALRARWQDPALDASVPSELFLQEFELPGS